MRELRLIDPDGYTVPGTVHTGYPVAMEEELRASLREVAEREAVQWANFGYRAEDYHIVAAKKYQVTIGFRTSSARTVLRVPGTDAPSAEREAFRRMNIAYGRSGSRIVISCEEISDAA